MLQPTIAIPAANGYAALDAVAGQCISILATGAGAVGAKIYGSNAQFVAGTTSPANDPAWSLLGRTDANGIALVLSPWGTHVVQASSGGACDVRYCDSPANAHPSRGVFQPSATPSSYGASSTPIPAVPIAAGMQLAVVHMGAEGVGGVVFLASTDVNDVTMDDAHPIMPGQQIAFTAPVWATHYTLITDGDVVVINHVIGSGQ